MTSMAVSAQSGSGSGAFGKSALEMIAVEITIKKEQQFHKFETQINPHRIPKKIDYRPEEHYLRAVTTVDCLDCRLSGDYIVFGAAYRRDENSADVRLEINFSGSDRGCNLSKKLVVPRNAVSSFKGECGVEVTARYADLKEGSEASTGDGLK